jgi:hypothetical protein
VNPLALDHLPEVEALALEVYRKRNPRSRAVSGYHLTSSSGTVTRATCVFCRCVIATCSAKWRRTKQFDDATKAHIPACAERYLTTTQGDHS